MNRLTFHKPVCFLLLAAALIATAGCKKMFDVKPEQVLDQEQMYRNVYDADAAVLGLYGKLLSLAKQHVILNELRADLMSVTDRADENLKALDLQTTVDNNPYADPRPFYQMILLCNDVIKNFNIMRADNKFSVEEYQQRYGDVVCLRSWIYLQVGIHFGTVPYITDPLQTIDDARNTANYPMLTLDKLVDTLVATANAIPFKNLYPAGTSLITTVDGYNTAKFFINKKCLLGDLYLWRSAFTHSSADARQAATYYKDVMETYGDGDFNSYRVRFADVLGNADLAVGYWNDGRDRQHDEKALVDDNSSGWRSMFARPQDALYNQEWIWMLYFDKGFKPANPFVDLFSNRGGSYLVKPSQAAMDGWNTQIQSGNNFPYDARGKLTYKMLDGQPVIMKYLYSYMDNVTYMPVNLLEKPGKWFLYRAAQLHLRFAEAANMDGRHKIAYALVNNGISNAFDDNPGVSGRDVTNTQQTFDGYPYNFMARNGELPRYRDPWFQNTGVRGRAHVTMKAVPSGADSTLTIENMIVDEEGLELAYEGSRWADLLRVAIRRNDPAFIADKIYNKLVKAGYPAQAAAARTKLMGKNWFLPFKW